MENRNIFNHIKDYWILYAFIVQLVVNFTITGQTLEDHAERIQTLEKKQESEEILLSEIRTKLSSIETSILFIKDAIK